MVILCPSRAYMHLLKARWKAFLATGSYTARLCCVCKTWGEDLYFHPNRRWFHITCYYAQKS